MMHDDQSELRLIRKNDINKQHDVISLISVHGQVEDLYGDARYRALGIRPNATQQEVRQVLVNRDIAVPNILEILIYYSSRSCWRFAGIPEARKAAASRQRRVSGGFRPAAGCLCGLVRSPEAIGI